MEITRIYENYKTSSVTPTQKGKNILLLKLVACKRGGVEDFITPLKP